MPGREPAAEARGRQPHTMERNKVGRGRGRGRGNKGRAEVAREILTERWTAGGSKGEEGEGERGARGWFLDARPQRN